MYIWLHWREWNATDVTDNLNFWVTWLLCPEIDMHDTNVCGRLDKDTRRTKHTQPKQVKIC